MSQTLTISRKALIAALLSLVLLLTTVNLNTLHAQDPNNDGRINTTPWVNSFGAVAVYCLDANAKPGGSYSGAGIVVLDANGKRLLFASDVAIQQAQNAFTQAITNTSPAPMCINTSLASRGHGVVIDIVGVQRQADLISVKYNLGEAGRLVTPDLSTIQFSLDTLDHQLLEIGTQQAAFLARTAGLRNTVAGAQNNAQLLDQVNGLDAQIAAFLVPVDAAIKRGGIIGTGLNGTNKALQTTLGFWRNAGVTGATGGLDDPTATDFETALASMGKMQGRVNSAAAGINTLTAGLQTLRNRLVNLRTRLTTMSTTLQADVNGAPTSAATLSGYLNEADNLVLTSDRSFKRPCTAPIGLPGTALLAQQGVYSLFALGNGNFQLNTVPDATGKTSVGRWNTCSQS
jgi:hypothetical protein